MDFVKKHDFISVALGSTDCESVESATVSNFSGCHVPVKPPKRLHRIDTARFAPAFYIFCLYAAWRASAFPLNMLFYAAFSGISVRYLYPVLFRYLRNPWNPWIFSTMPVIWGKDLKINFKEVYTTGIASKRLYRGSRPAALSETDLILTFLAVHL